ncbi:SDR family NAD(P)-dependent oxidoreductase [Glycomyces buryatensis]|uniref:SDR family oxidoreductase n=1 Tax=Glycomyces buryatensis TaxID=2570927 RepID=A0A4S8QLU8_9ACTN|nr:SDR family oxidoreductase [Glycomyces buryatensis]THV41714.1 SDR family oxidoreductase [Glycomyces buryatensis]
MVDRRWALVTGASSGIGEEFARQLARAGYDIALVARSRDRLEALAAELESAHDVETAVIGQDLAEPDAGARVAAAVAERGITVEMLVNDAGIGTLGPAATADAGYEHDEVMINVVAVTDLVNRFLPGMTRRRSGAIINVASMAGFQPLPNMAVYAASKAYVLNYSLALWSELRGSGVKVLAVCPGPVGTGFAGSNDIKYNRDKLGWALSRAEPVVSQSLAALERDRGYIVPDWRFKLGAHVLPRRPRKFWTRVTGRFMHYLDEHQPR